MDLSLDIEALPHTARPPIQLNFIRDLAVADLSLSEAAPLAPAVNRLAKLRDTHHALARALASGMTNDQAALASGYTPVRVSILKADPAFQELVSYYRENLDVVYADLHARMSSFSIDLLEELRSRFEDNPDEMSSPFLKELMTVLADRTGYGVKTTQVNVNIDLASRLEAARARAETPKVIEGKVND